MDQTFARNKPDSVAAIHKSTIEAGKRRVRPCLMTTATTVLALIPVLTSTGRGSDIMVPMAIPTSGGTVVVIITMFVVPVLYCTTKEFAQRTRLDEYLAGFITVGSLFTVRVIYCALAGVMEKRISGSRTLNAPPQPEFSGSRTSPKRNLDRNYRGLYA